MARLKKAVAHLPEVLEGTAYGTPSLAVRRKSFCRLKGPATLVVMCPLEEKEMPMHAWPDLYFDTGHHRGWPVVLVRPDAIRDGDPRQRLETAWLQNAPKTLAKAFRSETGHGMSSGRRPGLAR